MADDDLDFGLTHNNWGDQPDLISGSESPLQVALTPQPAGAPNVPAAPTPAGAPSVSSAGGARQTTPMAKPATGVDSLEARLKQREDEIDQLGPQIGQRWKDVESGYRGQQDSASALKQLLLDTQQRLSQAYQQPSTAERLSSILGAVASAPHTLGASAGAGASKGAEIMGQMRANDVAKQELMAKYGMEANQADQMSRQYGVQASQAGLMPLQQRLQQANQGADRLTQAVASQQMASNKYDPQLQAQLAYAKEHEKNQADMAMLQSQGGGQFDPKNPDPLTKSYAQYQVAFPSPPNKASPIQEAIYNSQLSKVLAVNPQFQQGNKAIADKVRTAFDSGQQGDKLRFFNNAMGHLQTYDKINQAMQKGDMPAANQIALQFGQMFGHPELTSAEAVQGFLGDELVNSIVPRGGTGAEREQSEARIRASLAPDQWNGVKNTYNRLLSTQVADLERQYRSSLHFMPKNMVDEEWNSKVSPEAQQALAAHAQSANTANFNSLKDVQAAVSGGTLTRADGIAIARRNGWIQ